ncbi:hypothetical protein ACOMHN_030269 [Nucella lapillus]
MTRGKGSLFLSFYYNAYTVLPSLPPLHTSISQHDLFSSSGLLDENQNPIPTFPQPIPNTSIPPPPPPSPLLLVPSTIPPPPYFGHSSLKSCSATHPQWYPLPSLPPHSTFPNSPPFHSDPLPCPGRSLNRHFLLPVLSGIHSPLSLPTPLAPPPPSQTLPHSILTPFPAQVAL